MKLLKQNKTNKLLFTLLDFYILGGVRHRPLEVSACYGSFQTAQDARRSGDYGLSGLNLLGSTYLAEPSKELLFTVSIGI